ncbi:hypothetical protein PRIPAC_94710, partial [Pristionchus pacificus]|uniref:Uncharacterized protein n=1 Tax=Pristionchus pacificus TaxID=54126 RepID=A0A2A6CI50_PRIPA
METERLRLAAEKAALKREFGLDAAGNDRAGSVGASLRRTVSEEGRSPPQHPASTSPVEAGPPAAPLDDQRSLAAIFLAAISERRALNRTASRPRSVTFGDAQEQMDIVAELNRSPSFIRRKAAHASDNKSESE